MDPRKVLRRRARFMLIWAILGSVPAWTIGLYLFFTAPPFGLAQIVFLNIPGTMLLYGYMQAHSGRADAGKPDVWWGTTVFNGLLGASFTLGGLQAEGGAFVCTWGLVLLAIAGLGAHTATNVTRRIREEDAVNGLAHHGFAPGPHQF